MSALTRYEGWTLCEHCASRRSRKITKSGRGAAADEAIGDAYDASELGLGRLERHSDASAAGRTFEYGNLPVMQPDDLLDEMET
jgi:hypothetical protein